MTKVEMVAKVAEKMGTTKAEAERALGAVFAVMTEGLAAGEKVPVTGFGTFEVRHRAARAGVNPATKEKIEIPASKTVGFKPSPKLKEKM